MQRKLDEELSSYGCSVTPEEFEEALSDTLAQVVGGLPNPEERLLYQPDQAKAFCNRIRDRLNCPQLPDEMILRRLQNIRKRGPRN